MINNIYAVILIFIYIVFVTILNFYISLFNKDKNDVEVNGKPAKLLYCYGNTSPYKLFKVTVMDLINRGYFIISGEGDKSSIKASNKSINDLDEFEKLAYDSINDIIKEDASVKYLDDYFLSEYAYGKVLYKFNLELKKEINEEYGSVYKHSSYIGAMIVTFIYAMQVLSFLKVDLSLTFCTIISILFTMLTVVFLNIINRYVHKTDIKRFVIMGIGSFLLAIIAYDMWTNDSSNNYLIFHIILGIFSFMYPYMLFTLVYWIRSSRIYFNKKQGEVVKYLNHIKSNLQRKKKYTKEDYIYLYGLELNKRVKYKYLK